MHVRTSRRRNEKNSRELIKRLQIELRRSLIVCASSRAEACRAPRAIPAHASVNGQFYSLLLTDWQVGVQFNTAAPRHASRGRGEHQVTTSLHCKRKHPRECAFYSQADSHDDDFLRCHAIRSEASKILHFAAPSRRTQAEKTTAFDSQGAKYCH